MIEVGRIFDLCVYTGNSRPESGMLRLPADRVDLRRWRPYMVEQRGAHPPARAASVAMDRDVAIVTIIPAEEMTLRPTERASLEDADDGWPEDRIDDNVADEASWPVPLALVRADLIAGDLRPLYLLWLLAVQCGERPAATAEPPRPPDLERPTGSLWMFAEFLRLNRDLMTVALEATAAAPRMAGQLLEAARAHATGRWTTTSISLSTRGALPSARSHRCGRTKRSRCRRWRPRTSASMRCSSASSGGGLHRCRYVPAAIAIPATRRPLGTPIP